ncbi:amidohydrolase family protein [Kutzneria sp. 744]|uniref:amidohydrolase family protein n=1 Tax=Kutzneria sp. (strain 744) TaxID=345341 RepID=UPI0005BE8560|nr:amidohydrolase family protein [Kutzneria sp. 744]
MCHKLFRAGIALWPGTDQLHSYTLQRELELYGEAGLTPAEALRTATIDAARHLGAEQSSGTIERGKRADFFLIPENPLDRIRAIRDVRLVVQGGRVYSPEHMHRALGVTHWTHTPAMRLGDAPLLPGQ